MPARSPSPLDPCFPTAGNTGYHTDCSHPQRSVPRETRYRSLWRPCFYQSVDEPRRQALNLQLQFVVAVTACVSL